jgi:hypothetical protein
MVSAIKSAIITIISDTKKGWLLIVRSLKEALQIADYSIFASSKALRKWIGLQKI